MKSTQEWVDSLKEGDEVAVDIGSFSFPSVVILTVEKITPSRIIKTSNGYTFNKHGEERGNNDAWSSKKRLMPITDVILEKIERKNLTSIIENVKASDLSLETLRDIVDILKTYDK
jgi:hypothetical protein